MPAATRPFFRSLRSIAVLLLAAAAAAFATVRWMQCSERLPAATIRFSGLSAMSWEAETGRLARTGADPHGLLVLPAAAVPVRELVLECAGRPPASGGGFQIYEWPYHLPGETISEQHVVTGTIEPGARGYRIRWRLADSKLARLDLPDELPEPVTVVGLELHSRFMALGQWAFTGFLASTLALGVLLTWIPVSAALRRWPRAEPFVAAGLIVLSIALARDVPLQFIGAARHDDALFVKQGASILGGEWLGKYDELTLSKGPGFPVFLALNGWAHLPLRTSQALLYGLGAAAFVAALRRRLPTPGARLLLLAALLFQANLLSASAVGRVLRTGIQPALTLLTFAGAIGLATAAARSRREMLGWALLAGFAGAAFWYSREEGIWIVPSVALLLGSAALRIVAARPGGWAVHLALLGLPFAIVGATTLTLRAINHHHYGVRIAVDVKDGYFPRAYGALVRIRPQEFIPGVPVSRETRLRAYAVSPTFAQLRPELEGPVGAAWSRYGWENSSHPAAGKEIRGGWFQWALRHAAMLQGQYRDAATADLFWRAVAREINRACDDGRLAAGRWRSGFLPRWDGSLWPQFRHSLLVAWGRAAAVSDFSLQMPPSEGSAKDLAPFIRVTNEPVMSERPVPTLRTMVRGTLGLVQGSLAGLASIVACLGSIWILVTAPRNRRDLVEPAILLALLGGALALVTVIALIDATSFAAVFGLYLAPATPLVVAWWTLTFIWLAPRRQPA